MKTKIIFFTSLLIITLAFISMQRILTDVIGPHGGKVKAAPDYNIESKVVPPHFHAYLLDKKNTVTDNANQNCEIEFFLSDGTSLSIPLQKYGKDGFTMDYYAADFNAYRLSFIVGGKAVNAKFETETVLVGN